GLGVRGLRLPRLLARRLTLLPLGLVLFLALRFGITRVVTGPRVGRIVGVGRLIRRFVAVGVVAALGGVVLAQRFRASLHTGGRSGGQVLRRQRFFEAELPIVQRGIGGFAGDLPRDSRDRFLRRVL